MGARVILTPAAERGTGMVLRAEELAKKHGWFLARQFESEANPAYHRSTTGPEILRDFADTRLDFWVTGWGTGGTMTGAGQMLKLARPNLKVIVAEPKSAPLVDQGTWTPHKIQGWAPDFVPGVLDKKIADRFVVVSDDDAKTAARNLAHKEGIFCGISSGATFAAALEIAKSAPKGSAILAMLPDTGERYLSTFLFDDLLEGSDDEWLKGL
jgi:cysteine synthase A